ncbi:delta(14)-sterol reductase isoform X2 [Ziziphus jujuba]|uniref:Delta(14)-sterol reductase n=1 Tax=Ziziphus jujuba TaxID=326968 RepID=A0A6P4AQE5_ZIZJJ|nr:delta(14)-sterol reductase isoform X2 [Ziziphus jujuba]
MRKVAVRTVGQLKSHFEYFIIFNISLPSLRGSQIFVLGLKTKGPFIGNRLRDGIKRSSRDEAQDINSVKINQFKIRRNSGGWRPREWQLQTVVVSERVSLMEMDLGFILQGLIPSWNSVAMLCGFFLYLAIVGSILPGQVVPGVILPDGTRLHYRCNGLVLLILLVALLGIAAKMDMISLTAISDRGLELLSTTFLFSFLATLVLFAAGCKSNNRGSSLKPHVTGNLIHDWWFGIQLNPQFLGIDLKAGMMGWLLINLSVLARSVQDATINRSMILYQLFCVLYILDYFVHEEYMTSTWDIIAERLGFMLVFGDLVWIPFTFSIQGWWLLSNKVELTTAAVIANCFVFMIGYLVFRGANKQKHVFKKNPKAPIWGKPPKVVGGKLLASGYWGIARHCNYLGDLLLALSFSLPCGISSPVPYFYPLYLLILLIWRERRDEARCAEKYKDIWAEYRRLVPWRILPYVY